MSLSDHLSVFFAPQVLERGERYFAQGRVAVAAIDEREVRAGVYGANSTRHEVNLTLEDARPPVIRAHCTCPHYQRGALCKHTWATLLELERDASWQSLDEYAEQLIVEHEDESLAPASAEPRSPGDTQGAVVGEAPRSVLPGGLSARSAGHDSVDDASATQATATDDVDPLREARLAALDAVNKAGDSLESVISNDRLGDERSRAEQQIRELAARAGIAVDVEARASPRTSGPADPRTAAAAIAAARRDPAFVTPGDARGTRAGGNWRRVLGAVPKPQPPWQRPPVALRFVINVPRTRRRGRLQLDFYSRQKLKSGGLGQRRRLTLDAHDMRHWPEPGQRALLAGFITNEPTHHNYPEHMSFDGGASLNGIVLEPPAYRTVLPQLAAAGVLFRFDDPAADDPQEVALRFDDGPPWQAVFSFDEDAEARQWLGAARLQRGEQSFPVDSALFCLEGGLVLFDDHLALLTPGAAASLAGSLLMQRRAGDEGAELLVPFSDRDAFLRTWWARGEPPPMTLPPALALKVQTPPPRGQLTLRRPTRQRSGLHAAKHASSREAQLMFDYDGLRVQPLDASHGVIDERTDTVVRRDGEAEAALLERAMAFGLAPDSGIYSEPGGYVVAERRVPGLIRGLLADGWRIESDGKGLRGVDAFELNVSSGIDWFDLEGGARFDDMEVSLPDLLEALGEGREFITLPDGTRGLVPREWLANVGGLLELGKAEQGGVLRYSRDQALLLDALLEANEASVDVDEQFARWRAKLRGFAGAAPAPAPGGFHGELRGYQREGLGWLLALGELELGGCLADDMGLGKTIQVLALLQTFHASLPPTASGGGTCRPPSLIVVPRSLVFNWCDEAARFAPGLRVISYVGPSRAALRASFPSVDLVVTTYGTVRRDAVELAETTFGYVVLDEAHAIKNASSQTAKACRLLNAQRRLAMTGTPIENRIEDLWSLFEFLNPGMLGRASRFQSLARAAVGAVDGADANGPASAGADAANSPAALLSSSIAPFVLRRTKAEVLKDLPPKVEQTMLCELPVAQRKLYDELRAHYRASLAGAIERDGLGKAKLQVLEALLRLRQAAIHPGLVDESRRGEGSAKLEMLVERLGEVVAEGHKALVFSQFTTMLGIVRDTLDDVGISYEYLDGRTRNRAARVERFQNDDGCKVFLVSLKAGGHGLNLTAADYVFVLDPWWNPAVESQAIDRAHRFGQKRSVFAYRLVASDTVEEKIVELKRRKSELADAIITADGDPLRTLTETDLDALLG